MQILYRDLLAQETKRDPIPFFSRLRQEAPLCRVTQPDGSETSWIALSYEAAVTVLTDARFLKDRQRLCPQINGQSAGAEDSVTAAQAWRRDMLRMDPPDHTRLRNLLSKAFAPQMIDGMRPRIQQITDALLDKLAERGQADLIRDFAFPLPLGMLSELLGVPNDQRPRFCALAGALTETSTPTQHAISLLASLREFIVDLLAHKRANPGNDLTTSLVQAAVHESMRLSETELISSIWLLVYAGYETTAGLIGNGVLVLLQHPEQARRLQDEPALLPSAVEEILRCTTPLMISTPRWAGEDIVLCGQLIRKGDCVFASLVAANTDPQQFPIGHQFDITRKENRHMAFGRGIHYCLGAQLARVQGQIALGTLLQRIRTLRLACRTTELVWLDNLLGRSLASLPVIF